ncbi:hypothetical protein ATER59S_00442 [Aquamicrobium terrae]
MVQRTEMMDRPLATETASQQAVRALADLLVRLVQGARMPTMQELNSEIRVGIGTLQKAITVLREARAVDLRARGHMGTYIEALDHARLWNLAGRQPVTIMLPFIDAPEFRGLSDGLTQAFDRIGIRIKLEYRRGALTRLKSVSDREADACIVSRLAIQHGPDLPGLPGDEPEGRQLLQEGIRRRHFPPRCEFVRQRQDRLRQGLARPFAAYAGRVCPGKSDTHLYPMLLWAPDNGAHVGIGGLRHMAPCRSRLGARSPSASLFTVAQRADAGPPPGLRKRLPGFPQRLPGYSQHLPALGPRRDCRLAKGSQASAR